MALVSKASAEVARPTPDFSDIPTNSLVSVLTKTTSVLGVGEHSLVPDLYSFHVPFV